MAEKSTGYSFSPEDAHLLREQDWGQQRDRHHVWFSRSSYEKGNEKKFRSFRGFIVPTLVEVHHELHANVSPPPKPSHELMRLILVEIKDSITPVNNTIDILAAEGRHDIADNLSQQVEFLWPTSVTAN